MRLNTHSHLIGHHAFLSASKGTWLDQDDEKLAKSYVNSLAARRGVERHNLAYDLIRLGQRLEDKPLAFNQYVNHGIGFKMSPEQVLFATENAYGTADTCSFWDRILRIHDYKSGLTVVTPRQLFIYAAYFCIEYDEDPNEIGIELRIYQGTGFKPYFPDPRQIERIMHQTIHADAIIKEVRREELS